MPCPHTEITIVQRSQRQSAVAAAAYQSGEKLFCEYDQQVKHYPEKRGMAVNLHSIRSHVLHLMRGQVFELEGYHFFTMGGAKSNDTEDGILEPGAPDFERKLLMLQRKDVYKRQQ